ncbi:MAG: peptidoglycan DD-metalloendopeptidase family protein [Firmicutes bacterium]|nr:peptidoglycan DD-metalloendopeptidase family protein [Bacillota bacterium]
MNTMHNNQKQDLSVATYIQSDPRNKKEKQRFKAIQRTVSSAIVLLCVMFLVFGGIHLVSANSSAYVLVADGKEIATLASMTEAEAAIDQYIENKSAEYGMDIVYSDDLEINKVSTAGVILSSAMEAADALDGNLHLMAKAEAICINGVESLYVPDEETAREAIDLAKQYYADDDSDDILSVTVAEQVSVIPTLADIDQVLPAEEAKNMLLYGCPDAKYYFVATEGETFAEIAERNGVSVESLKAINTVIADKDALTLGTAVALSQPAPMISVLVEKEVVQTQAIPYSVVHQDNSNMNRGEEKVISEGIDGLEEVTLRVVVSNGETVSSEQISATTLVEPVDQVVERGTKVVLSSRSFGGSGSGVVGWPYTGTITSRFGWRSRGWHSGLDIAGPVGEAIYAAESGTVTYAGWYYGYGNLVKIDHGSGMETYYGHLSAIYVNVGDTVERGQHIAALGNTGNSTGPHVHFEVRFDGTAYNPLDYLE